eukprot:366209-Chlamydomonas_euryale.AAC.17
MIESELRVYQEIAYSSAWVTQSRASGLRRIVKRCPVMVKSRESRENSSDDKDEEDEGAQPQKRTRRERSISPECEPESADDDFIAPDDDEEGEDSDSDTGSTVVDECTSELDVQAVGASQPNQSNADEAALEDDDADVGPSPFRAGAAAVGLQKFVIQDDDDSEPQGAARAAAAAGTPAAAAPAAIAGPSSGGKGRSRQQACNASKDDPQRSSGDELDHELGELGFESDGGTRHCVHYDAEWRHKCGLCNRRRGSRHFLVKYVLGQDMLSGAWWHRTLPSVHTQVYACPRYVQVCLDILSRQVCGLSCMGGSKTCIQVYVHRSTPVARQQCTGIMLAVDAKIG